MAQTHADTEPIAPPPRESFKPRLIRWFYEGYTDPGKPHARPAHTAPCAIAALLLYIRDQTGHIPHGYFGWTEGNPITYLLRFLAVGEDDTALVTREILRQSEPDPQRRPRVHVG